VEQPEPPLKQRRRDREGQPAVGEHCDPAQRPLNYGGGRAGEGFAASQIGGGRWTKQGCSTRSSIEK
jgi:hypothetical protein